MNESDLRALLASEAGRFQPDPGWLIELSRPPRVRRGTLTWVAAGIAALLVATMVYMTERTGPVPMDKPPQAQQIHPLYIRLTGYVSDKGGTVPADLQRHVDCMRREGFDLPDPEPTATGWIIKIDDPDALGIGSDRWKQAAFDTCALVRNRAVYDRWIRRAILHPRRPAP